jgi:hypothetical protein
LATAWGSPEQVTKPRTPTGARSALLWSAVLCSGFLGGEARAQIFDTRTDGISVGRFLVYPSLTMEYTQNDNVFYRSRDLGSADIISSGVVVARPRILVDLPLGLSRIRWAYSPQYRDYSTDRFRQGNPLSHFFDLEAAYRNGRGLSLILRDHLVRSSLELQQADRGGELTFGLTPFEVQEPSLELNVDFAGRQGFSLIPRYSSISFSDTANSGLFDSQRRQLEGRYNIHLSPSDTLYGYYLSEWTNQQREFFVTSTEPVTSRVGGVGVTRTLNQAVIGRASAGYQHLEFDHPGARSFNGLVLDLGTFWSLSDVTRLELTARRQAYQSFFANVDYYADHLIGVRLLHQVGSTLYWSAGATFQRNVYGDRVDVSVTPQTPPSQDTNPPNGFVDAFESYLPSQGVRRRDSNMILAADAGWQVSRTLRLSLGYNFERRRSNIAQDIGTQVVDPFDYRVERIILRVEAGWM